MEFLKYGAMALIGICELVVVAFAIRSGKFFKTIFINALFGITALVLINLTARFTNFYIPINEWTVSGGALLGLPGVLGMLVLPFVFI